MEIQLTPQERAAIYLHLTEGLKDRRTLYIIAHGQEKANKLKENSLITMAANWFNSHRIQNFIKDFLTARERENEKKEEEIRKLVEAEANQQEQPGAINEKTNFLDRDEFLSFLNTRANEIQDDKLRNDILKMLSDNLRYKDTERDENNEIQRFYTPVVCETCPIYLKCSGCSLSSCPKL